MSAQTSQSVSVLLNDFADGPRLLADVGGTNARFGLERGPGRTELIEVLPCANYPSLAAAMLAYLASPAVTGAGLPKVRHAAIAIANPVSGDFLRMTNHNWEFSIEATRQECGFDTFLVINDFTALARSLPLLPADEKHQVGSGAVQAGSAIGLIGPGTGLGVSGLIPSKDSWIALLSEGGHVSFSPVNATEMTILQFAWNEFEHVSAERLLSGAGLELIYRALAQRNGVHAEALTAADISRRAINGECQLCDEVVEVFCGMLGTIAGNLAVTLGAMGGIYIGGGIVPKLGDRFNRSCFRGRFEQKGRFVEYLSRVPTFVITAKYPAFLGVSAILAEKLGSH